MILFLYAYVSKYKSLFIYLMDSIFHSLVCSQASNLGAPGQLRAVLIWAADGS